MRKKKETKTRQKTYFYTYYMAVSEEMLNFAPY